MKTLGGTLLIVGTAIGAGMLALPMATARGGFIHTLPIFIAIWALMTMGAFYILEVNMTLPEGSNLISMSKKTCGPIGLAATLSLYAFLLYSVVAAYIAAGGDLLEFLLQYIHIKIPLTLSGLIFTLTFSMLIYSGIKKTDWVNRGLMLIKLVAFILLLQSAMPHINQHLLYKGNISETLSSISVITAAFTFGIIVPSMRQLFNSDLKKLRKALLYGSIIPLISYILWDCSVQGIIPTNSPHGLNFISFHSSHPVSDLVKGLMQRTQSPRLSFWAQGFTSVCVLTSFLGVGISLVSFLSDGIPIKNNKRRQQISFAVAFIPPWLIMVFFPQAFTYGVRYAGFCALILMMLLPGIMAYRSRYHLKSKGQQLVFGGKPLLVGYIMISTATTAYVFYRLVYRFFT